MKEAILKDGPINGLVTQVDDVTDELFYEEYHAPCLEKDGRVVVGRLIHGPAQAVSADVRQLPSYKLDHQSGDFVWRPLPT